MSAPRVTAIAKLHPTRIRYSDKMCAIVACILGERWTQPRITDLIVTTDLHVLACHDDDPMANEFLGMLPSLRSNWSRLLTFAGLNPSERRAANAMFRRFTGHAVRS